MLRVEEALGRILGLAAPLETEWVSVAEAIGRVTSEPVIATRTLPPWDNSAMDGYALRSEDLRSTATRLRVSQVVYAGHRESAPVTAGTCARIFTGAPLPAGADAVVMQEKTRRDGEWVEVLEPVGPNTSVRPRGEDAQKGDTLISAETPLGIPEGGLIWSQGKSEVAVHRRPRVAILSTGDELCELGEVDDDKIVDSNSHCLSAAVSRAGGLPTRLGIASDSLEEILRHLRSASSYDLVITSAGVSVGDRDFVREALAQLGVEMAFWRVAIKPGKPLAVGRKDSTVYFGLPGNPTSSLVSFELFVRPAVRRMLGHRSTTPFPVMGRITEAAKKQKGLTHYIRATATLRDGEIWAQPLATQTSGALRSAAYSTHLIVFSEDSTEIRPGDAVPLIPVSWSA
jgi:molybdopterin molybdotransferase